MPECSAAPETAAATPAPAGEPIPGRARSAGGCAAGVAAAALPHAPCAACLLPAAFNVAGGAAGNPLVLAGGLALSGASVLAWRALKGSAASVQAKMRMYGVAAASAAVAVGMQLGGAHTAHNHAAPIKNPEASQEAYSTWWSGLSETQQHVYTARAQAYMANLTPTQQASFTEIAEDNAGLTLQQWATQQAASTCGQVLLP